MLAVLNGYLFVLQTGIPWEDLSQSLGYGSGMDAYVTGMPTAAG